MIRRRRRRSAAPCGFSPGWSGVPNLESICFFQKESQEAFGLCPRCLDLRSPAKDCEGLRHIPSLFQPKMAPRWLYNGQDGASCGLITSKMAPHGPTWLLRRLQDGPRCRHDGPRRLQRGPWRPKLLKNLLFFYDFLIRTDSATVAPEAPPRAPREPQDGPRSPQDGSRWPQDGPKTAPDDPKTAQDGPNGHPGRVQDGPQMVPRAPPEDLQSAQDAARQPFGPLLPQITPRPPQNDPKMAPRSAPEAPK